VDFIRATGVSIPEGGGFPEDRDIRGRLSDNTKTDTNGGSGGRVLEREKEGQEAY